MWIRKVCEVMLIYHVHSHNRLLHFQMQLPFKALAVTLKESPQSESESVDYIAGERAVLCHLRLQELAVTREFIDSAVELRKQYACAGICYSALLSKTRTHENFE